MTKEELAAQLDGAEYPLRLNGNTTRAAKEAGLVIVYGASDDLMELDGAIRDEFGCYDGGTCKVDKEGILPSWEEFRDSEDDVAAFKKYFQRERLAKEITAIWNKGGYSWQYATEIPHATFEVVEDGEKYCRGIVFSVNDI